MKQNMGESEVLNPIVDDETSMIDPTLINFNSELRCKSVIEAPVVYNKWPKIRSIPRALFQDYSRLLAKPFLLGTYTWNTQNRFSQIALIKLPSALFIGNNLTKIPFDSSTYFRAKMCVLIQAGGTPSHGGTVIASVTPRGAVCDNRVHMGTMTSSPHALINACNSEAVCIEVPFYVNGKLMHCDTRNSLSVDIYQYGMDYAQLIIMVLNKLVPPNGGSTAVTITVHAMLKDMEFYCPHIPLTYVAQADSEISEELSDIKTSVSFWERVKSSLCASFITQLCCYCISTANDSFLAEADSLPSQPSSFSSIVTGALDSAVSVAKTYASDFIDVVRGTIKAYTGLHNPNSPIVDHRAIVGARNFPNTVDLPVHYEKLDPYGRFSRVTRDYDFDTDQDEMDIRWLCCKPHYIGSFTVADNTTVGRVLFSRPINPAMEVYANPGDRNALFITIPMQMIYNMSRAWRGALELYIYSGSMTNFHYAKLAVVSNYSNVTDQLTKVPVYSEVQNLLVTHLEFSGGGQVQCVRLPFISPFNQLECTNDWANQATQHGVVYIMLEQPLVASDAVANNVEFDVFVSGTEETQFFGYATHNLTKFQQASLPPAVMAQKQAKLVKEEDMPTSEEKPLGTNLPRVVDLIPKPTFSKVDNKFVLKPEQDKVGPKEVYTIKMGGEADLGESCGASVPQEVPDSSALLPDKCMTEKSKLDACDLRPIISIRDFIRRLYSVATFRYTGADLIAKDGLYNYSIAELIGFRGENDAIISPLEIVSRMFYGVNGGVRVKIVIGGAAEASLLFVPPGQFTDFATNPPSILSSTPIPSTTNIAGTLIKDLVEDCMSYFPNGHRYPVPFIETSSVFTPNSAGMSLSGGGLVGVQTLEAEIPNMSILRFIGDMTKAFTASANGDQQYTYTSEMGNILLSILPVVANGEVQPVKVQIFMGYTDETRFGYQVIALPLYRSSMPVPSSTSGIQSSLYNNPITSATLFAGPVSNPQEVAPAAFIGST